MTRFYKKISPAVKLQLSNGLNLQFINVDGHWGVLKVGNEEIQRELAQCIKSEIGGVSEITEAEYNEMFEKKTTSPGLWREEFGKNTPRQSQIAPPREVASAVDKGEPERFPDTVVHQQPIVAQPAAAFRPMAIPRKN